MKYRMPDGGGPPTARAKNSHCSLAMAREVEAHWKSILSGRSAIAAPHKNTARVAVAAASTPRRLTIVMHIAPNASNCEQLSPNVVTAGRFQIKNPHARLPATIVARTTPLRVDHSDLDEATASANATSHHATITPYPDAR